MGEAETKGRPTCFMAMPITTRPEDADRYDGDTDHWAHVMQSLFEKAAERAGMQPIRPVAQGSHLIHGLIIRHLSTADLVLVDLSAHNPNVFFELGVRTSLNLPIALVRDEHTSIPFDTSGINTYTYDSKLRGWEIEEQQRLLAEHIRDSASSCAGENPLWRQFGLTIKANEPDAHESPLEAKVDLLTDRMLHLQAQLQDERVHREHDRSLIQDEMMRTLGSATWADLQRHDPGRTAPSELFASAVDRVAGDRFGFRFAALGPAKAVVEVDNQVTAEDVHRLRELASRYEVDAEIVPVRHGPKSRAGTDFEHASAAPAQPLSSRPSTAKAAGRPRPPQRT
jgi:hypothetical protein